MIRWQALVHKFMLRMNQPTPRYPTVENYPAVNRATLILEEAQEFAEACGLKVVMHHENGGMPRLRAIAMPGWTPDAIPMAHAVQELADIVYATVGAAEAMGVNLEVPYTAVHEANMQKTPAADFGGKVSKPEGWASPLEKIRAYLNQCIATWCGPSGPPDDKEF